MTDTYKFPELLKTVKSNIDNTVKYIFRTNLGYVIEVSYINKNDGKDIICLPSQTMCEMACKFCHTTDYIGKIPTKNINHMDLIYLAGVVIAEENLIANNRPLLISFMGCGEPLININSILLSMIELKQELSELGIPVRFSLATSLPEFVMIKFFTFCRNVKLHNLQVKLHLSLHHTDDKIRSEWMPNSMDIESSIRAVHFYKTFTGNKVEIHYALINGINDKRENALWLAFILAGKNIDIKLLFYNKKDTLVFSPAERTSIDLFKAYLEPRGIKTEYYIPPGLDIGASCGQFLLDYIEEQTNIKN